MIIVNEKLLQLIRTNSEEQYEDTLSAGLIKIYIEYTRNHLSIINYSSQIYLTDGQHLIDTHDFHQLGQALKENRQIESIKIRHLFKINLAAMQAIAPAFAKLTSLKSLNLSETNLNTEAINVLCNALKGHPNLMTLDLSYNGIESNTIPSLVQLINNSKLEELNLNNPICPEKKSSYYYGMKNEGAIQLAYGLKLNTSLKRLKVNHHYIEEAGLSALCSMGENTTLDVIDLTYNQTGDGSILAQAPFPVLTTAEIKIIIERAKQEKVLDISYDVKGNNLTLRKIFEAIMAERITLKRIKLGYFSITTLHPDLISTFDELEELCLSSCTHFLSDEDIKAIASLPKLSKLIGLYFNSTITAASAKALAKSTSLRYLGSCTFGHKNDEDIISFFQALTPESKLEKIDFSLSSTIHYNSESILVAIAALTNLKELSPGGSFADSAIKRLAANQNLEHLGLHRCGSITSEVLNAFANHLSLRRIGITTHAVDNVHMATVATIPHLKEFYLDNPSSQLTAEGIQALARSTSLEELTIKNYNGDGSTLKSLAENLYLRKLTIENYKPFTAQNLATFLLNRTLVSLKFTSYEKKDEVLIDTIYKHIELNKKAVDLHALAERNNNAKLADLNSRISDLERIKIELEQHSIEQRNRYEDEVALLRQQAHDEQIELKEHYEARLNEGLISHRNLLGEKANLSQALNEKTVQLEQLTHQVSIQTKNMKIQRSTAYLRNLREPNFPYDDDLAQSLSSASPAEITGVSLLRYVQFMEPTLMAALRHNKGAITTVEDMFETLDKLIESPDLYINSKKAYWQKKFFLFDLAYLKKEMSSVLHVQLITWVIGVMAQELHVSLTNAVKIDALLIKELDEIKFDAIEAHSEGNCEDAELNTIITQAVNDQLREIISCNVKRFADKNIFGLEDFWNVYKQTEDKWLYNQIVMAYGKCKNETEKLPVTLNQIEQAINRLIDQKAAYYIDHLQSIINKKIQTYEEAILSQLKNTMMIYRPGLFKTKPATKNDGVERKDNQKLTFRRMSL